MTEFEVVQRSETAKRLYFIREMKSKKIAELPTRFLVHRIRINCSPNTVRREAYALVYYLSYLRERQKKIADVFEMHYEEQYLFFTDFLSWIKKSGHTGKEKMPGNATCNTYLRDVFEFYQFLSNQYELGTIKVMTDGTLCVRNAVGVKKKLAVKKFRGYLPAKSLPGKGIEQEKLLTLLLACTNSRDQLLLLLLAETGFRIGEMLGVCYDKDIDYEKRLIRVHFRAGNKNGARAKYAEERAALISKETYGLLMYYLSENQELIYQSRYLFVVLAGDSKGQPLKVSAVYAMLRRLEQKTGIKATPHMLRHYFATERRKSGWDLVLISKALGHKHIETTIRYLDIGMDELIKASDQYYKANKPLVDLEALR